MTDNPGPVPMLTSATMTFTYADGTGETFTLDATALGHSIAARRDDAFDFLPGHSPLIGSASYNVTATIYGATLWTRKRVLNPPEDHP